jgi:hypothetical protein
VQEKELVLLLQIFEANFVCNSRQEAHGREREREGGFEPSLAVSWSCEMGLHMKAD